MKSRRDVILLSSAILADLLFIEVRQGCTATQQLHCFLDESGLRGGSDFYVGMLVTGEPRSHTAHLQELRQIMRYKLTLKYRSSDKFKVPYGMAAIDYFLSQEDMKFVGLDVTMSSRWPNVASERDVLYFGIYDRLIDIARMDKSRQLVFRTERRSTTGRDELFFDFLRGRPQTASVRSEIDEGQDLLQLADLFTGSIRVGATGVIGTSKLRLERHLAERLGVPKVSAAHLGNHRKFRIRKAYI